MKRGGSVGRKRLEIFAAGLVALLACFTLGFYLGGEHASRVSRAAVAVEEIEPRAASSPAPVSETAPEESVSEAPLDLNQATQEELEALPGIGPELARRILDYRETYGPFLTTDQIMEVSGIGEKRYDALKELITVEEQDEDIGSGR